MKNMESILANSRIIPVIVIRQLADALPLAQALIKGGINVLEITLRTPMALEAIRDITQAFPDCKVAAGTILNPEQFTQAQKAGACFAVSPGTSTILIKTAQEVGMPYLPGVTTCSEVLQAREMGIHLQKFYPAQTAGGVTALKNFAELFQDVKFCPTGGINENNCQEYLALANVLCIGGSWLAPQELIHAKQWNKITERAKNALKQ